MIRNQVAMMRVFGKVVLILFLLFSFTKNCVAQYLASLANGQQVNDRTFEFDFYIKSTALDFTLVSYQCALTFNTALSDGGTLTFAYIGGSSELVNAPLSTSIDNTDGHPELCFYSFIGNDVISSTNKRVGKFRLTNSIPFAAVSPDIAWNFAGSVNTILSNGGDITNQSNFSNLTNSPLPVELTDFSVAGDGNNITLNWNTATEVNNYGFEIERKLEDVGKKESWGKIGFVKSSTNSNVKHSYNFEDKNISLSGKYFYRLKTIDLDGTFKYSDEINTIVAAPEKTTLEQNYPNPFNPQTNIKFKLSTDSHVKLCIYAVNGELVEKIIDEPKSAGFYSFNWNANLLASGMYISILETVNNEGKSERSIKKMLFVK